MSNGGFQGKYVHFNVIPNYGKIDQHIVSKPLVYKIASHQVMTIPHETDLTATQESSPLSRQDHAQQAYTSHATTYQYPNSNVMPGQESPQPYITSTPGQIPYLHQNPLQLSLQQSKDSTLNDVVTQHLLQQMLNQSHFNDTLGSILNNQQSLQRKTISMMNKMLKRHENKQFICDIQMFNGKNIDFDE